MFKKIGKKLSKELPLIFTTVGSVGAICTVCLAIKATPKAVERIDAMEQCRGEGDLTKAEIVRGCWTLYIPAFTVGAISLAFIYSSCFISAKRQANLIGAYAVLDKGFKEYREKVKKIYGEEADRIVKDEIIREKSSSLVPPSDEDVLIFYEENYGEFFERRMAEVLDAEYQLNRKFALEGEASLGDFWGFLGLDHPEHGSLFGWSVEDAYDFYGYSWIEFEHELIKLDDGMECYAINMPYPPAFGFRSNL